ncbi:MAG: DMT family transporter [Clostridiales bacterium]|nr:DMT family transporter [Clostridiales bacterium]
MGKTGNDFRSVIMIISSMLIFGTIGVFRRAVPLPSAFLAFSRGITGGLFILAFIKLKRKKAADRLPFRTKALLALSGALMGINWILLFEAYNYTTVAVATLCYYMQPTIVVLLSPVIFREKLTAKRAVCAFIAIAGMVLVSGVTGGGELPATNAKGIILGLGAAVFYSAVVIMNKRISSVDAYLKTVIQLLSAGLVMVPYLLVTGGISGEGFTTNSVLLLLVMGILHTGIAYVLYFGSIDGLKAQSVAILSYIDPVSALLFSALFLKEALRAAGILGAVMIIGSAVISEIQTDKTKS